MPFSAKTPDFLFENCLNDSKAWFTEHKEDYKKYIAEPFTEFVNGLADVMREIDPEFICDPKKISRLYRDTRFARGGPIFRDYVWYSFRRPRESAYESIPEYYFSVSANGFDYGCGFYCAAPKTVEVYRRLILEDSAGFKKALKAYEKSRDVFEHYGELYKRNKYPDESTEKQNWLNRKNIGLSCFSKDFDLLFSSRLIDKIAADFTAIAPVYHFYMQAEEEARREQSR